MFLTASNIFHYLRDAGLVSAQDVCEGRFTVLETKRRNRNFVVEREAGRSLFVKQIPMVHAEVMGALRREAACVGLARDAEPWCRMRTHMPILIRHDPVAHVLVYEFADGAENLNQRVSRVGPLGAAEAARIGTAMATFHAETARPGSLVALAPVVKGEAPWIMDALTRPIPWGTGFDGARGEVFARLQASPDIVAAMRRILLEWRRLCLVHGDIKHDNILISRDPAGADLLFVDWELADVGEPLWDVAGALVGIVQTWLLGTSVAGGAAGSPAASPAVTTAARALWSAYGRAAPGLPPPDLDLLARLVGARFVLLALELLPEGMRPNAHVDAALVMARFFFADPLAAAAAVFGLTPGLPDRYPTLRVVP